MKDVKMIVFLLVTFTVCTILLASANMAYERASSLFNVRLYATILELFDIPFEAQNTEAAFKENFDILPMGATVFYRSKTATPGTLVFKAEGPGLWSRIELLLAVNPGGESLHGLRVLSQAETPGLGGRIGEPEFQARFHNVDIRPKLRIVKFAMSDNEVDAVTGASMTSAAVAGIINRAVQKMDEAFPPK